MARLIEAGHLNAWRYGYGFFLTCADEHSRAVEEGIRNMAMAFRIAQADERAFSDFLRSVR